MKVSWERQMGQFVGEEIAFIRDGYLLCLQQTWCGTFTILIDQKKQKIWQIRQSLSQKCWIFWTETYLQVTLVPGSKQGPVRLTLVPPNMFPFSGANTRGRLAPTEQKIYEWKIFEWKIFLTEISDADSWQNVLINSEDVSTRETICSSSGRKISDLSSLRVGHVLIGLGSITWKKIYTKPTLEATACFKS